MSDRSALLADPMAVAMGSVCSGYGGIELGLGLLIPQLDVRWVADYEPPTPKQPRPHQGAAKILAHRFPGVPNLGDITAADWAATEPVDIIAGGTPCQDVSQAGPRVGMKAGTRSGIWSSMVAAIEHHRPTLVVWENVKGALYAPADSNMEPCPVCLGDAANHGLRALGRVLGDLAELGYDAVWLVLPASAVGAPHQRERVFVCAWPATDPRSVRRRTGGAAGSGEAPPGRSPAIIGGPDPAGAADPADTESDRRTPLVASRHEPERTWPASDRPPTGDTEGDGRDARRTEPARLGRRPHVAVDSREAAAVPDGVLEQQEHEDDDQLGRDGRPAARRGRPVGPARPGRGRSPGDRPAPGTSSGGRPARLGGTPDAGIVAPADAGIRWGEFEPAIHRWEVVLDRPAPSPTGANGSKLSPRFVEWMMGLPAGHVTDVPGLTVNDQLHALGNGVVPQQLALAVRTLLGHAPPWLRDRLGLTETETPR